MKHGEVPVTTYILDTEIMGTEKPVFLVCIKKAMTGEKQAFWSTKKRDRKKLFDILSEPNTKLVTFNGYRFDLPLLALWFDGYEPDYLKTAAQMIVEHNTMPWEVLRKFNSEPLTTDHIDLINVAPGVMTSLKTYAGRMNMPSMIDLPYHHSEDLKPAQLKKLEEYCCNDVDVTHKLYDELSEQIKLREHMSEEYAIDLRSKSDAQIAEAVLKQAMGIRGAVRNITPVHVHYHPPEFIETDNEDLVKIIKRLSREPIRINPKNGSPELPEWLKNTIVTIGEGTYQMGIGGLHSTHDRKVCHRADDKHDLLDIDVASYYPSILINTSEEEDSVFLEEYKEIYEARMAAKHSGDKVASNTLKIMLNGSYGKLGSIFSALYDPELLLKITLTGQLNLLCLIHDLHTSGIEVLSANTDGIIARFNKTHRSTLTDVIQKNAQRTGFVYEETPYRLIAMKDVNNYIAVTTENRIKTKGLYASPGLMKNPTAPVCSLAAQQYILDGTSPRTFVLEHRNVNGFMSVRNVRGGAEQDGVKLGRVVRWYMSKSAPRPIRYASNGNLVPKTEGAKACLDYALFDWNDLDRNWYVREAERILSDIGVKDGPNQQSA